MRIAYISLHWPRTINSGVGKKIVQQLNVWQSAGHEVHFFMHTHPHADESDRIQGTTVEYKQYPGSFGKLQTEFSRSTAVSKLLPEIEKYKPDIIYLRWGMYVFPFERVFNIAPVVLEINTNDVYQHSLLGTLYGFYNRFTRNIFLSRSSGMVCASHELATAEEFSRFNKPTTVIANGFDMADIQPLPAPNNQVPRLIFIGTPGYLWHGVDKLVLLAQKFPDVRIDVIGYDKLESEQVVPENLVFYGYLKADTYLQILAQVDVGIGNLALHRMGMKEASPLKTREYLAYGVPLVLPYKDTDLDDLDCEFLLKIPNQEDNIITHGMAIRDFAYRMRGHRVDRNIILDRIDARHKELKRLAFFEQIIKN